MRRLILGIVVSALMLSQMSLVSAAGTKTIHVGDTNNNSLADVQGSCTSTGGVILQWHFVINGIKNETKPSSITVSWSNGGNTVVSLDATAATAKVGHYTVKAPGYGLTATTATAQIFDTWKGQFVLSDVTCGVAPPAANVTLTKSIIGNYIDTRTACFTISPMGGTSAPTQCYAFAAAEQHTFVWNDLAPGDYVVEETTTPDSYAPITPAAFSVRDACGSLDPQPCYQAKAPPPTYDLGTFENLPLD